MKIKLILFIVTFFLLKFSFAQEKRIITINPGEGFVIENKNENTFNLKFPIELENLKFQKKIANHHFYKDDKNWIVSYSDLRDTSINEHGEEYRLDFFPINLFDSVLEIGYNGWFVSQNDNYFIIDNQSNLTKIETEKKPFLLTFSYIYKSGIENEFKYVVKDIYNHSTISEFNADSILFMPTDWIHYLVISYKNNKSLIDFKNFKLVQDSILHFEKLNFNIFISCNKNIIFFQGTFGQFIYGISNATNFKLLGRKWGAEFIDEGVSFDYKNGSGIINLDGQLKYLKNKLNDSISLFKVDFDAYDSTCQILNINTAEILIDSICDFNLISKINHSLIYRTTCKIHDVDGSLLNKVSDYHIFSKDGNDYRKPFFSGPFSFHEDYYWHVQPQFNRLSLINVFRINKDLIDTSLANSKDKKTKTIFEYVFYNIDSLKNEDRIAVLNNIIKNNPRVSELYYFRSKLNYQLNNIKEASMDIDSALLINNSLDNFVRRIQFDFMHFNKAKKDKKRLIIQLTNVIDLFETPNVIDYKIYDLYWVKLNLIIQYNYPKKEIREHLIKLKKLIANNPTILEDIFTEDIKKLNELSLHYKIK
jgi:hypothetical protein